jgi:hypothetical protein
MFTIRSADLRDGEALFSLANAFVTSFTIECSALELSFADRVVAKNKRFIYD